MEEEGLETETAGNGADAFRSAAKAGFDLIITDVRMPGLTGLDILPGLRKLMPQASIIVITAFGSPEVFDRARLMGADAYLEKPIHLDQLRVLIQQRVRGKERRVCP